ncbi:MAG: hypothetical protein ACPLX7_08020 [Candidatus Kapaibacteriota bacterium]
MAKRLTYFFLLVLNYSFLFAQIIAPKITDSIVAGKNIVFHFAIKSNSLQRLDFSFDQKNWIEIAKFANRTQFEWAPPLLDLDTIFFRYEAYNFSQPEKLWTYEKAHLGEVSAIDFLNGDSVFVSSGLDGKIYFWHIDKGIKIDSFVFGNKIFSVRMLGFASKVVFSSDTSVYCFDFSSTRQLQRIGGSSGLIRALAVDNSKKLVAFGSYAGDLYLFDSNFTEVRKILHQRQIYSMAFAKTSNLLAVGDYDGFLTIYDYSSGKKLIEISTNKDSSFRNVLWSVAFDYSDSLIAVGGIDGKIRIYNVFTGNLEYAFPSHSFHIRGVDFCNYAPVVISVSLDSTLYQTFFPMNFPVHFPIKVNSSITSLITVDGGQYLLLGMRDGTISFLKNFEFEHIVQPLALPYFIPVKVECGSFQANAGRMASFPIILKNIFEVPLIRFPSDTSFIVLKVPLEHFGVYHPENGTVKYGRSDTLFSNLRTIGLQDTFQVVQVYTLHPWGDRKAEFYAEIVNFRGKHNIQWIIDTAAVEIVEICKPLTDWMRFELVPGVNFTIVGNPVCDMLKLLVETDTTFFCKFVLINAINGRQKILFEGEIQKGTNEILFDINGVPSGVYQLVCETKFLRLARKLIIY